MIPTLPFWDNSKPDAAITVSIDVPEYSKIFTSLGPLIKSEDCNAIALISFKEAAEIYYSSDFYFPYKISDNANQTSKVSNFKFDSVDRIKHIFVDDAPLVPHVIGRLNFELRKVYRLKFEPDQEDFLFNKMLLGDD